MAVLALTEAPAALEPLTSQLSDLPLLVSDSMVTAFDAPGSPPALILLDAEMDGATLPLLGRLAAEGRRVVLMSRAPTLRLTVQALRRGAADVLSLPPDADRVRELAHASDTPGAPAERSETPIVGRSPELLDAYRTVARVADSNTMVLLQGESGTGKEMFARLIHDHGVRAAGPFVAVNCAALPENLLESELFGHEKDAIPGALGRRVGRIERASGGTLFLDEIGEISATLQSKLLRALEERRIERIGGDAPIEVDVRVVAATHRDLRTDVASGRFREDLYYRLAVVAIELPPLRARGDDVRLLAEHFLLTAASDYGRAVRRIDIAALALLRNFPWPGNVRQLRNAIERAVLLSDGTVLRPAHLPPEVRAPEAGRAIAVGGTLADVEKQYIERVLEQTGGHMARAAEVLGIHRNTLRRKLETYGLA